MFLARRRIFLHQFKSARINALYYSRNINSTSSFIFNQCQLLSLSLSNSVGGQNFKGRGLNLLGTHCVFSHAPHRNGNRHASSQSSSSYADAMYKAWSADPKSVHPSWDSFFRGAGSSSGSGSGSGSGASAVSTGTPGCEHNERDRTIDDHLVVQNIIRSHQYHGHYLSNIDPIGLFLGNYSGTAGQEEVSMAETLIKQYQSRFTDESDFDKVFHLPPSTFIGHNKDGTVEKSLPYREIIRRLKKAYCSTIGVEYMNCTQAQTDWIRQRLEPQGVTDLDTETRKLILRRLTRSAGLEEFLAKKWSSEKRFGLEGCEVLIPCMKQMIDKLSGMGVNSVIMGMAHRGRLNVLANVCRKPLVHIFTQFNSLQAEGDDAGSGDVKYHLGTYVERINRKTNKKILLSVVANPSHLEASDPVVQGRTRSEQFYRGDREGKQVMSILIHGDAAFSGQGVVFETFHLGHLPEYTTHGTIHIIINNQVGFTTDPRHLRSNPYCTNVAHVVNAPIFHVNSDDPDAVIHVANMAAEWRNTFSRDVVVDIVCYRRNGHNEIDEPMFTQPLMYKNIKKLKPIFQKYSKKLIDEGIVTEAEVKELKIEYERICEESFEEAQKTTHIKWSDWLDSPWEGFFNEKKDNMKVSPTGVDESVLMQIGKKFSSPPPAELKFEIHKGIDRILKGRTEMMNSRSVDWAFGEAFAIGSLLKEGVHVRLSGQDAERGTFSHRHHVLHDQKVDKAMYYMLQDIFPDQAEYTVCNSSLSEYGVLGFELGYSMTNPNSLVCWEAQFGDFNNTAQCIIDQFISSGQSKWVRQSGLVLLLPHGMEGMGPEHSSARLERFLQMSSDDQDHLPSQPFSEHTDMEQLNHANWIIANCSTPANLFHILRRQLALPFRKPLILMTPKSLLRHPECKSSLDEMLPGTKFLRVIPDSNSSSGGKHRKLIFCSGRVYYDLKEQREKRELTNEIAIARIEQLSPFPYDAVEEEVKKFPNAKVTWVQEEHKNSGPWTYIQPRMNNLLNKNIEYAGRSTSASPATGSKHKHYKELKKLFEEAFA